MVSRTYLRYKGVGSIEVDGNCCVEIFNLYYYRGKSQILQPGTKTTPAFNRIGSLKIADCDSLCEDCF